MFLLELSIPAPNYSQPFGIMWWAPARPMSCGHAHGSAVAPEAAKQKNNTAFQCSQRCALGSCIKRHTLHILPCQGPAVASFVRQHRSSDMALGLQTVPACLLPCLTCADLLAFFGFPQVGRAKRSHSLNSLLSFRPEPAHLTNVTCEMLAPTHVGLWGQNILYSILGRPKFEVALLSRCNSLRP